MANWQVALLVIAAVFVGIWIPVSVQLFATLRSGQRFLETMGSRGAKTLGEVSTTVAALNQPIADVGEVTHAVAQLKDSFRIASSIGAAVVPALVALVRALRKPEPEAEEPEPEEPEPEVVELEAEEPTGGNGASAAVPEHLINKKVCTP